MTRLRVQDKSEALRNCPNCGKRQLGWDYFKKRYQCKFCKYINDKLKRYKK